MKLVHVAVAVIEDSDGNFLIAHRHAQAHMGGLWEFPGGKVEVGETVLQALQREIAEEVGLCVQAAQPLLKIPFAYPDKHVLLDVWRVTQFSGIAQGCEGQVVQWVSRAQLSTFAFPSANRAILTALRLPERVLITGVFSSVEDCVQRVERAHAAHAMAGVMLRAHALPLRQFVACSAALQAVCSRLNMKLLLNMSPEVVAEASACDGLHLTAARLLACTQRPALADRVLLGASCHNAAEVAQAVAIGADYVTLSPVLPTASHPNEPALGWEGFADLLAQCPLPVLALGGLDDSHLPQVKALGGLGVAAISAWW